MTRKFYRTTVKMVILSEDEPWSGNLETLAYDLTEGLFSGAFTEDYVEDLSPRECALALLEQDTDPGFFMLDDEGNDLYEDLAYAKTERLSA